MVIGKSGKMNYLTVYVKNSPVFININNNLADIGVSTITYKLFKTDAKQLASFVPRILANYNFSFNRAWYKMEYSNE